METFDRKLFGARLRAALEAKGLTQTEAARLIGERQPRVSEYLSGRYLPAFDKIWNIVHTLGLDPKILFPEWTKK